MLDGNVRPDYADVVASNVVASPAEDVSEDDDDTAIVHMLSLLPLLLRL